MKPTTGYETNRTENNIIRGHTYVTELTKTIPNLGLTEIPDEFFLGWINPYLLSDCMKSTGMAITGTGDEEGIEFVPPTYTTNVPMGYMYQTLTSGAGNTMLWTENGGTLQINASYNNPRFIKKFYPECYSLVPNSIVLGFDFNYYTPPPDSQLQNANAGYSITLNFGEFKQFVKGQYSKEITFTWKSFPMKVTLTGTDFTDGTAYKTDENGSNYEFRIFLRRYSFQSFYGGENASTSGYAILPMIQQNVSYSFTDLDEDFTVDELRAWSGWTGTASLAQLRMNTSTHTIRDMTPGTAFNRGAGACQSSIKFKVDALDDEMLLYGNGIVGHKTGGYIWNFYVYYKIEEIEKMLNLFARVSKYTIVSYMPDDSFATKVDSNDEFLAELHSGNIQDQSFRESLREWQYVPLNDDGTDEGTAKNEFDPETDLPPYDPTPPEPPTPGTDIPDDENPEPLNPGEKGDEGNVEKNTSVPNAISAFTTSYIMTELEVSSFGNRLWTSVQNEPSAQRNFFTISNDEADYELTNSNIIDYLVSLKWYPFSITQYCNFSTWSAYLIGSGTYAYTGSAYVAEDAVGYIPGGSVNIPWSTNTFVDLEPYTSVSFYIPFCGTIDVPASKVRGRRVTLDYYVDYITGGCTAYLTVPTANGSFPVASINGTLGFDMLATGNNAQVIAARAYQQNNERRLREIEGLGGAIVDALGGLVSNAQSGGGSKSGSSRDFGSVGGITSIAKSIGSAAFSEIQGKLSQGTIQGTSPLTLGSASTLSGLGYIQPFAAVTSRVFFNNGTGYDKVGYISNKPLAISSIKDGVFFNCINPELKNVGATNSELAQITSMLSSGVYK